MADQKRWFKVWTSVLVDMDHLSDDLIGKWTRLGCRTALVGNNGRTIFENREHLRGFMKVNDEALDLLMNTLPNITFEEGENRHGKVCVTFKKWLKYQRDSTQAQRAATSRSKRRGEEKREEEKRKELPPLPPAPADAGLGAPAAKPGKRKSRSTAAELDSLYPPTELFMAFWLAYPKKKSQGDAQKAWHQMRVEEQQLASLVMETLEKLKQSFDWRKERGKYVPFPASWLRAKGWSDQTEPERQDEPQTRSIADVIREIDQEEAAGPRPH